MTKEGKWSYEDREFHFAYEGGNFYVGYYAMLNTVRTTDISSVWRVTTNGDDLTSIYIDVFDRANPSIKWQTCGKLRWFSIEKELYIYMEE